jgi:hypothetical protein
LLPVPAATDCCTVAGASFDLVPVAPFCDAVASAPINVRTVNCPPGAVRASPVALTVIDEPGESRHHTSAVPKVFAPTVFVRSSRVHVPPRESVMLAVAPAPPPIPEPQTRATSSAPESGVNDAVVCADVHAPVHEMTAG